MTAPPPAVCRTYQQGCAGLLKMGIRGYDFDLLSLRPRIVWCGSLLTDTNKIINIEIRGLRAIGTCKQHIVCECAYTHKIHA